MESQLTEELAQQQLDPVIDFMLTSAFPEHLSLETYLAIQNMLILIGLNMVDTQDVQHVDNWLIKLSKKIKRFEIPQMDYVC